MALYRVLLIVSLSLSLTACWLAVGAVGVETGYVASQETRTTGETIDDQILHASIKSKLMADPEVSGLDVNVDVFRGMVQLRGYLKTQKEIDKAVELARSVQGVKGVESKLNLY